MLKIGDFSKLSRISIRMLRHYDEIGLLVPKSTDPFTGYRYYGEDQLPVAGQINSLKDMGFGLSAIGEILKIYDDPQKLAEFLSVKQAEVKAEAEETEHRLLLLETAIKRLRKDGTAMSYNVTLKTLPERYVASVRQIIPAYAYEGKGRFVVTKTGAYPMRTRLKLFLEWGITFGKPYEIAEQSARKVEYANRHSLEEEIIRRNAACEADPEEKAEPDSSASAGIQHTPALEHKAPEQQKSSIRI